MKNLFRIPIKTTVGFWKTWWLRELKKENMGRKKGRRSLMPPPATPVAALPPPHQEQQARTECFQGDRLTELLQRIGREIELERLSKGGVPDKIWIKRQFAIGANDVTRVLERMGTVKTGPQDVIPSAICNGHKGPLVSLQARGSGINKAVEEALGGMGLEP